MGNLITIAFSNDSYDDIKNNPKQLHRDNLDAMFGIQINQLFYYRKFQ